MSEQRDEELYAAIFPAIQSHFDHSSVLSDLEDAAWNVVNALEGYSKPRTITDWAELGELHMAVVRTEAGSIANIVNGRAYFFGYEAAAPIGSLSLPATVLYEPTPGGAE